MECQYTMLIIFTLQSTCMEVCVSLSCLFVHEPLYQIYSSVLQSRFCHGMNHRTALHVRVRLAQAHPNNTAQDEDPACAQVEKWYKEGWPKQVVPQTLY